MTEMLPAPSARELDALIEGLAPGAQVIDVIPMGGGRTSSTHEIRLVDGPSLALVMRRHPDPSDAPALEAEQDRLLCLRQLGLPVPSPVLFDEGDMFGVPTLVVERLAGGPDLSPTDPFAWAEGMGRTLAAIHAIEPDAVPDLTPWWAPLPPEWRGRVSQQPWGERAWRWFHGSPPKETPAVLLHGDFQSTNVLWSGGEVSGVVDWFYPGRGSAGIDVGEARAEIVLLFDRDVSDRFLAAYVAATAAPLDDIDSWDVRGAMVLVSVGLQDWAERYASMGRTDLSVGMLAAKLADWVGPLLPVSQVREGLPREVPGQQALF